MRLDDVIASHKRSALTAAAIAAGQLLAMFVPPLDAWRMTAMSAPVAVTQWLIRSRSCRLWAGLSGGCLVAGSLFLDYLLHQTAPVLSPYVFFAVWFILMASFGFWLARKEQRATATGEREGATRASVRSR